MKSNLSKTLAVIYIIVFSVIIASVFGALHNQISYSVSSEFFKDFLFGFFGVNEWMFGNDRLLASIIGVISSYWVGLIIGVLYAIIFLFMKNQNSLKYVTKAIFINIGFAILGSFIAFIIAYFFVDWQNVGIYMDLSVRNPQRYVQAAYMHNGSYYGGFAGLVVGIAYLLKKNKSTD